MFKKLSKKDLDTISDFQKKRKLRTTDSPSYHPHTPLFRHMAVVHPPPGPPCFRHFSGVVFLDMSYFDTPI